MFRSNVPVAALRQRLKFFMKADHLGLLACVAVVISGCKGRETPQERAGLSTISEEESAGLRILADYAAVLVTTKGFPDLDPYQATTDDEAFQNKLEAECPDAVEASVNTNTSSFFISSGSIESVGGERTNRVNTRHVRDRAASGVTSCKDVTFEYTTLDGESGSVPATTIVVDQTIGGKNLRLILSTKRPQPDGEPKRR
ncbi:MAG: hypothetical protein V4584_17640 [Verrucomicrobiota bacterium]